MLQHAPSTLTMRFQATKYFVNGVVSRSNKKINTEFYSEALCEHTTTGKRSLHFYIITYKARMFSRGVQRLSSKVLGRQSARRYGSDHSAVAHGKDAHHSHGEVTTKTHKQEVKELDGWLFGEKYVNINPTKSIYEQIPENAQYLWGIKVCINMCLSFKFLL